MISKQKTLRVRSMLVAHDALLLVGGRTILRRLQGSATTTNCGLRSHSLRDTLL